MKYIIMAGGQYNDWETPRQLLEINGEAIIARTIRLLKENGIDDIYITANGSYWEFAKHAPVILHENKYTTRDYRIVGGHWNECFYITDNPTCYIFGDVVFSPEATKKIIETPTDDIEFFASAPPFDKRYIKPWAEPFAFKVTDAEHLKRAIEETNRLELEGRFNRKPIAWELWQVIKGTPINQIDYTNYTVINDYTCDIDHKNDIWKMREVMR